MTTYHALKSIVARSRHTLLQDAAGVVALMGMTVASLYLPLLV